MKVFISWSGPLSQECAELLRGWIKCTLQASDPWISSKDLDKGSLWFNEISDKLKDTRVGIVCLTKDNKDKPWILFESGALAKGIATNKVCTLLIDLKPSDLDGPLTQFNHTEPNRAGMKALLSTINKELGEHALEEKTLDQVFDTYWVTFEKDFKAIIKKAPEPDVETPARSSDDMLEEILYTTRKMDKRIRLLERPESKNMESLVDKWSTNKALNAIKQLVDDGLTPNQIVNALKNQMNSQFIHQHATEYFDFKTSMDESSDDNE